jgi:hypothetical protein
MGPDYSIITSHSWTIELVEIFDLKQALKDDPTLDNTIPPALEEQFKLDMEPASQPSTRKSSAAKK